MKQSQTIDQYIQAFPQKTQALLKTLRLTIKKAVPAAQEKISYGIPTFTLNGNLVHFGGFKSHVSFFPAPRAIAKFKKELLKYKGGKGTIQFPLDKPLPLSLITRMVKFRVKENLKKKK